MNPDGWVDRVGVASGRNYRRLKITTRRFVGIVVVFADHCNDWVSVSIYDRHQHIDYDHPMIPQACKMMKIFSADEAEIEDQLRRTMNSMEMRLVPAKVRA